MEPEARPRQSLPPSAGDGREASGEAKECFNTHSKTSKQFSATKPSKLGNKFPTATTGSSANSPDGSSLGGRSELSSMSMTTGGSNFTVLQRCPRSDSPVVLWQQQQRLSGAVKKESSSTGSSGSSRSSKIVSVDVGGVCGSSRDSYDGDTASASCSMPASEAGGPAACPAIRPALVNPSRLQSLGLVGEAGLQQPAQMRHRERHAAKPEAKDGGKTASKLLVDAAAYDARQQRRCRRYNQNDNNYKADEKAGLIVVTTATDATVSNNNHHRGMTTATATAVPVDDVDDDGGSTMLAASATLPRPAVYQYSFRVPDTRANMRPFGVDPNDRRVESIARACDAEILLDPRPIRTAAGSVRLRRVTIRAPDMRSLEKCCRQFDHSFPHFYASSGLGPDGAGVCRVFLGDRDDGYGYGWAEGEGDGEKQPPCGEADERYIVASHGGGAICGRP